MATSKNIILAFLLVCALFGNVFAQMIPPPWYETETVKKNSLEKTTNDPQNPNTEFNNGKSTVVIDSIAIYYKMINLEHAEAKYTANAVGMVGGGLLTALGIACIISANNTEKSYDNSKSKFENDLSNSIASSTKKIAAIAGVIFILGGLPIFIYNLNTYSDRKKHAEYRDTLKKSLERYIAKKKSAQLIIVPTINLANAGGGGINAVLQF